jgi:hypothetical protein
MTRSEYYELENYEPEYETGVCSLCGETCDIRGVDEGIGPYEFWGIKGTDVQIVAASSCCSEPIKE